MNEKIPQEIHDSRRTSNRRIAGILSGALIVAGGLGVVVASEDSAEKDVTPVGWSPVEQDRFTSCFRETGEWILGATYESDFPHDKRMDIEIISAPGAIETVDDDDAEGGQDVTATAFAKFPSDQGSAVIEFAFTYPGSPGEVDKKTISGNKPVEKCPGGETTTTTEVVTTTTNGSTTTIETTTTVQDSTTTTVEVTTTTQPNGTSTTTTVESTSTTTTNPNGSTTTSEVTTTTEPDRTTTTVESTTTTLPDGTTTTINTTTTTQPDGSTTTSTTVTPTIPITR